ncbi:MAG TPA: hypothetical protein VMT27_07745 [Actinomycetes bacterium]|nr:hypothetical protein [Actinomycetes bacterium]
MNECPHCRNNDQDQILGHEIPDHRGNAVWQCLACGWAWPVGTLGDYRLDDLARRYAAWLNSGEEANIDEFMGGVA